MSLFVRNLTSQPRFKMSEVMNIPRLRFNHFDKEWTLSKVFETGKILTGSTPPTNNPEYYDGNFLFVSPSDLGSKKYISKTSKRVSRLGLETGRAIPKNSIMFVGIGSTIGKVGVSTEPCITNQQIHSILPNPKFNTDFIYYVLRKNKSKIRLLAGTQAVPQLNKTDFSKLNYYYPSLPEQQKIADFLTAVDKRIELLEKKKTLLETYKKGVMKKIFNQEIRFKDDNGIDFLDWREMKLGNVLTEYISKTKVNNQHEVLSSTIEKIYRQSEYFNHQVASKDNIGYKVLKLNQLVFSPQNIWMGNINVNTEFEKGIVSPSYKIYDFKPGYDYRYFKDFLKQPKMLFEYTQSSEQGASVVRRNLNLKLFLSIPIKVPSLEEQMKISNFLSSIDNQIELLETQIDKTKTWKKGLLQKMFV